MKLFSVVLMAMMAASTHAQVIKCTNPKTGKITYSSTPCEGGHASKLVEDKKSIDELMSERLRAAEANERKYRSRLAEIENQRTVPPISAPAPVQPSYSNQPNSYECLRVQRDHETISSIRTGSEEERRNRINASTVKVNIACGVQTELIQPPARPVIIRNRNVYP